MSHEAVNATVDRIITAAQAVSAVGPRGHLTFHFDEDDVVRAVAALIGGDIEEQTTDHGNRRTTRCLRVRTAVAECSLVVFGLMRWIAEPVETLEFAS